MASELKPCPFCGSNQLSFRSTPDMDTDGKFHRISCNECGASSRATFAMDACPLFYEELRNVWNTRPAPAATDTGLEIDIEATAENIARSMSNYKNPGRLHGPTYEVAKAAAITALTCAKVDSRPATDTGLKTIGFVPPMFVEGKGADYNDIFRSVSIAENYTAVVTLSQADELLAAKDADMDQVLADNRRCLVRIAELEADNAAKDERIKTETELRKDHQERNIELEAKLAAAQKALEPFADHANDQAVDDTGWRDKETVKIVVSIGDLRKARAVLGGEPSC